MANWWEVAQPAPAAPAPAKNWWDEAKPAPSKYAGQGVIGFGKEMAEKRAANPQYPEIRELVGDTLREKGIGLDPFRNVYFYEKDRSPLSADDASEAKRLEDMFVGLMSAQDDESRLNIITKQLPGAEFQEGPEGSILVHYQGKTYYLNKPGTSGQDIGEMAVPVAAGALAAAGGAGLGGAVMGTVGRMAGTGAALVGESAWQDLQAREKGSGKPVDWWRAGTAGLLGGAFEGLAPLVNKALRKVFPSGRDLFEGAGLSQKGRAKMLEIGIDPDQLTPESIKAFRQIFATTDDAAAAVRQAEAQTLPVPGGLTSGQATQNPWVQTVESALKGIGNDPLLRKQGQQSVTMTGNKAAIQEKLGGALGVGQGAGNAREFLLTKMKGDKRTIKQLFDAAKAKNASLPADEIHGFAKDIRKTLIADYPIAIMPTLRSILDDFGKFGLPAGNVTRFNLKLVEQWRRQATNAASGLAKTNPSEAGAIRKAVGAVDSWLDDVLARGKVVGDQDAVGLWNQAIKARREFGDVFERTDIVRRLVEKKPNGGGQLKLDYEDAVNEIFGKSSMSARKGLEGDLTKLKELLPADEWSGLRQEAFLRFFGKQGDKFDSLAFAREMDEVFKRRGKAMAVLFTPEEIGLMQQFKRYVVAVNKAPTILGKVNTSGTAATAYFYRQFGYMGRAVQMFMGRFLSGGADAWSAPAAKRAADGLLPARKALLPPGAVGGVSEGMEGPQDLHQLLPALP